MAEMGEWHDAGRAPGTSPARLALLPCPLTLTGWGRTRALQTLPPRRLPQVWVPLW